MLEQELKLTAPDASILGRIVESSHITPYLTASPAGPRRFLARYYDNNKRALQQAQCSLRSRLEGQVYRAAFKEKGQLVNGLSQRIEIEADIDGWLETADMLPQGPLRTRVLEFLDKDETLIPLVTVDMSRRIFNLEISGTRIECVTDSGRISGNNKEVELHELELELKGGEIPVLEKLGNEIKDEFGLAWSVKTKHEIGLGLWQG